MTLLLIKISTSYLGGDKIDLKGVGLIFDMFSCSQIKLILIFFLKRIDSNLKLED